MRKKFYHYEHLEHMEKNSLTLYNHTWKAYAKKILNKLIRTHHTILTTHKHIHTKRRMTTQIIYKRAQYTHIHTRQKISQVSCLK
jgi:hypothetical protein